MKDSYKKFFGLIFIVCGIFIIISGIKSITVMNYAFIAQQQLNTGKETQIEGLINKALKIMPSYKFANFYTGSLYRKQNRWKEAQASLAEAFSYSSHPANTLRELGSAFFYDGQYDKAFAIYRLSLDMDIKPSVAADVIYYNYGKSAAQINRNAYALQGFYKAIDAADSIKREVTYLALAETFLSMKFPERALFFAATDIASRNNSLDALKQYFNLFVKMNSIKTGIALFESEYEKSRLDSGGVTLFASLLYLDKRYAKSFLVLKKSLDEGNDSGETYFLLGKICEAMNNKDEMKVYYKKYLQKIPDPPNKKEIEEKIQG